MRVRIQSPWRQQTQATLYLCYAEGLQILTRFLPNFEMRFGVNTTGVDFEEGPANGGAMYCDADNGETM